MGYTHYWTNKSGRKTFTPEEMDQLAKVLDYWQDQEVICFESDEPEKPYELTENIIWFNERGDDGCETFVFNLSQNGFQFCKTNRRPYYQAVCECLILLREFLGDSLDVSSDGDMFPGGKDFEVNWKPAWKRLKEQGFKITWADEYLEIDDET